MPYYPRDISKHRSLSHLCDDFAAVDALVTELMDQEPSHLLPPVPPVLQASIQKEDVQENVQEVEASPSAIASLSSSSSSSPVAFVLPEDWQVDETTNPKSFIHPNGDKRFRSLLGVERYINGERKATDWTHVYKVGPCPRCISGSGKMDGHLGSHITFALPEDWQVDETTNPKSFIHPNGDKRFKYLIAVERYINGERKATDWTNIKKNWTLMDTHRQGYMNKQVGSCPCESCNVEIPSSSSSSSSSTTSNEQTTKSKKKRKAPTSSAVSSGIQKIKKRKKSHGSNDSEEDEKEDVEMLLGGQDDDDDEDDARRNQGLLTITHDSTLVFQVPAQKTVFQAPSVSTLVVDNEEAFSSEEESSSEEEEEEGDYLDQITTLSGLRDAAGTLNLNKAKSNYKADELDELRKAIRVAVARLCLNCREAVFHRWCELEQNRKKGSSSKSNIAATCRKQFQGLTDDQKNGSNGMNFHHVLQNSTLSIILQDGIGFAIENRSRISETKTNTITHKNSLAAPSKTNISNCGQVPNGDVVKNKGKQIITNLWASMYACFQEHKELFIGGLPTSDEMTGNYTSDSVFESETEKQQRFMGGKTIWSLHDLSHGGKHVKAMLTDDYLSKGREAKYDQLRHEPESIKGGEPTLYLCDTTNGSVMTGNYVDNAKSTHAWSSDDIDYKQPGDCRPHQDWLDSEAAVVAASISRKGMRLLVQIVFRVPGSGNAAIAMAILREHWLGNHIDPISSGSVSKVTSSSSSSSSSSPYVPDL